MSTRKRNCITDDELANKLHTQPTKLPRKTRTTHTVTHTVDADEHKTQPIVETMNSEESELASSSAERSTDESPQRDENASPNIFDQSVTDNLLREMDVLIARAVETRRELESEINQSDSEATIIVDRTDAAHPANESSDTENIATTSSASGSVSANSSRTNNEIDDSVVLIEDSVEGSGPIRPIVKIDDEDVIFVNASPGQYRTIATIDLCDTPDTSFVRTKDAGQSTSTATTSNAPAPQLSPQRPGTTKCPICLETFGFDEILSTMCGHLYCEPCIKNVIKTRKKCPMCNRGLNAKQVHRIFLDT